MSLTETQFLRYSRHLLMPDIGEQGQQTLLNAHVLIVGLGGLGCPVSLYLVAAGVGRLSLCDADMVDITNLQRQILYSAEDCDRLKVESAKARLTEFNPEVQINTYAQPVDATVLADRYTIVLDCTDNLPARQRLNAHCQQQQIPFISASALGWEGQLVGFDFSQHPSPCFDCIIDRDSPEPLLNCANSGVVGPVLGAMGSLQATTAIRMLLGLFRQHAEVQRYDGKSGRWLTLNTQPKKHCGVCSH
jgi:molybdopterin/thiamine biosynthesis adenylyltransferase